MPLAFKAAYFQVILDILQFQFRNGKALAQIDAKVYDLSEILLTAFS